MKIFGPSKTNFDSLLLVGENLYVVNGAWQIYKVNGRYYAQTPFKDKPNMDIELFLLMEKAPKLDKKYQGRFMGEAYNYILGDAEDILNEKYNSKQ